MADDWITPTEEGGGDWIDTPHDHPVEEKPTFASRAIEPVTSYPQTLKEHWNASTELGQSGMKGMFRRPSSDLSETYKGPARAAMNLGKVLAGGIGQVFSPVTAGLQTVTEKPVENITGSPLAGKVAGAVAGLALPGYGLTKFRPPVTIPSVPPAVTSAVADARAALARQNMEKASQFKDSQGRSMELSYGEAAQDPHSYAFEDQATAGGHGKPAQEAALPVQQERFDVMHGAADELGNEFGGQRPDVTNPHDAARVINDEMRQHAERIRQTQRGFESQAAVEEGLQRGQLENQQRALEDIVRGGGERVGNEARDTGELVGQSVRQRAAAARTGVNQAYENAFALPGEIHAGAFEGVGTRIKGDLTFHDDPVIIDDVTTPVASRAIQHLDKSIDQLHIQNRADPMGQPNPENITAVNLRGVDQLRKQLNRFYAAARSGQNPSDARAMGRIIDAFDNQVESAVTGNLFSGDPRALQALRDARGAYRNYTQTFRPQGAGDDVGQAMRRIIDRQATPEETARMVIGSGAIGNAGLPVRLAARLEQVFGRNSQEWSALRQEWWRAASAPAANIEKTAQNIERFSNSTLGRQVFSPEELAAMRNHAQGMRTLEGTIQASPIRQQAQRFAEGYERFFSGKDIGGSPGQTLRKIADGTATTEDIVGSVFRAIAGGKSGDAARMVDAIKALTGQQSSVINALREGTWRTITQKIDGMDRKGFMALSQDIHKFAGSPISGKLFAPDEIKRMREFAEVVRLKAPQAGSRSKTNPSGSAVSFANMARRVLKFTPVVTHGLGAHFGIPGHVAAHGINRWLDRWSLAAEEAHNAKSVERSLQGLPPTERASGGRAMADGGDPGDADMSQDAAEAAAARVRAPYARAEARESGLPSLLSHYGEKVKDVLTGPQDALEGRLQVNDPETNMPTPQAMSRASEFAGTVVGGGMPMAERGALGIFGGRLSQSADQAALRKAEGMAAEGHPPEAIWKDTGWFQGADQKWRYEIPDNKAAVRPIPSGGWAEGVDHPDFFEAYPEMANYSMSAQHGAPGGFYRGSTNTMSVSAKDPSQLTDFGLHEMQHAVQNKEGFLPGSNPNNTGLSKKQLTDVAKNVIPEWSKLPKDHKDALLEQIKYIVYKQHAGEVEARNVETRRTMTPEERLAKPPWQTEDTPRSSQVTAVHNGDVASRQLEPGTKEFAKAATQAKAEIAAGPKGAGPLDLSSTAGIPETPQVPLERYVPPRGISPRIQEALQNPGVARGVEESVKHGVETYGAEKWYHTEPIRRAFVDELGPERGMKAFDQYMHLVAATSPRSDASTNVRNASFYYGLQRRGEPIPEQNPQPYGHVAQNLHKDLAQNIMDAYKAHDLGAAARPDPWDLMRNPKPASFVENLRGNLVPGTMDTHAFRNIGMRTGDPRFLMSSFTEKFKGDPGPESMVKRFGEVNKPNVATFRPQQLVKEGRLSVDEALKIPSFWESKPNPNEYAAAEQLYSSIGKKLGMPTADTQAAAWAGAGKLTGLETPPTHTFPELFNERVLFTSKLRNEPPQTTLRRFIRGEAPLLSIGGVLALSNGDWSRVGEQEEGVKGKEKPKRASGGRIPLSTRRESNYSPTGGHPDHHCGPDRHWPEGFCAKFRGPHSCSEVGGFIAAHGHCDWYKRAPEGRASGGRVLGHYVDLNPTEAQKAAGNYRKAHITMHGLGIAIENPKGSQRHGVGHDGEAWSTDMPAHYGYIKGFIGRDKDHIDVYVGPYTKSKRAWVVEQHDEKTGRFDEHKVFLGFGSEAHVRRTYAAGFSDGKAKDRLGRIREMSVDDLKKWLHTLRYERAA